MERGVAETAPLFASILLVEGRSFCYTESKTMIRCRKLRMILDLTEAETEFVDCKGEVYEQI